MKKKKCSYLIYFPQRAACYLQRNYGMKIQLHAHAYINTKHGIYEDTHQTREMVAVLVGIVEGLNRYDIKFVRLF